MDGDSRVCMVVIKCPATASRKLSDHSVAIVVKKRDNREHLPPYTKAVGGYFEMLGGPGINSKFLAIVNEDGAAMQGNIQKNYLAPKVLTALGFPDVIFPEGGNVLYGNVGVVSATIDSDDYEQWLTQQEADAIVRLCDAIMLSGGRVPNARSIAPILQHVKEPTEKL